MKKNILIIIITIISLISCDKEDDEKIYSVCEGDTNTKKELSAKEYHVLINKGTESPFSGALLDIKEDGVYVCKICSTPLFHSEAKFDSGTGWPSFDDAIKENIKLVKDGHRIEVICANCGGHMGHVFYNEGFTEKETRYCINSVSLNFVKKFTNENDTNK
ncbi:peptide-methionine (R)-S-oxide reductase MsrB [Brachyspira pulli]|uniref:peptide-methionine (R)-S-oxide reductase MsrB n=1 Tax=Brachyspira pulli TaxID=310721 RepID=UPI0030068572